MSKVAIKGADTGTGVFTLESPATNTDRTLVLPDEAGTVLTNVSSLSAANLTGTISSSVTFPLEINKVADISTSADNGAAGFWSGNATETVNLDTLSLWDSTNNYLNFSSNPGYYIIMWVGSVRLTTTGICKIQFDGGDGTFRDEISRTLNNSNPGSLCTPITYCGAFASGNATGAAEKVGIYVPSSQGICRLTVYRVKDSL